MGRVTLQSAEAEAREVASWVCDCGTMIEDHEPGPHCASCARYWQDVRDGLFDDDWSPFQAPKGEER